MSYLLVAVALSEWKREVMNDEWWVIDWLNEWLTRCGFLRLSGWMNMNIIIKKVKENKGPLPDPEEWGVRDASSHTHSRIELKGKHSWQDHCTPFIQTNIACSRHPRPYPHFHSLSVWGQCDSRLDYYQRSSVHGKI